MHISLFATLRVYNAITAMVSSALSSRTIRNILLIFIIYIFPTSPQPIFLSRFAAISQHYHLEYIQPLSIGNNDVIALYQNASNDENIRAIVTASIRSNLVGNTCDFEFVDSFQELIQHNTNRIAVSYYEPTLTEYNEYFEDGLVTLTSSNPPFGKGYVIGQPSAEIWAAENKLAWSIPAYHPRNTLKQHCVNASKESGIHPVLLYSHIMNELQPYYIMKLRNVFVNDDGIIAHPCGYLQGHEACETLFRFLGKRWRKTCLKSSDIYPSCHPTESKQVQEIDTVFIITAQWDHNFHHYLLDSLLRLVRYIDFLKQNPSIKIQIRGYEKFADSEKIFRRKEERALKKDSFIKTARELRKRINDLLDISNDRLIVGAFKAKVVYYPRPINCNSPISHALEVRLVEAIGME